MEVILAESAGFCFGVNKAVNAVYDLLDRGEKVATLGPIIHNPQLVEQLRERGVTIVSDPTEVDADTVLVIRSHGVPQSVYEDIKRCGVKMYDATCPFVSKIHRIVAEKSAEGYRVFIAGDAGHPEVMGICGHCLQEATVFSTPEELDDLLKKENNSPDDLVIMVAQTTYHLESWKKCAEKLKKHYTNPLIFDTICNATAERQNEAIALSQRCDKMVIVGGRQSSNTAKLYKVCSANCPTVLVETAAELDEAQFEGVRFVGLTAGASTPADIIKEVQTTMSEIKNTENQMAAEAVEATQENVFEEMTSEEYEKAIDATFQNPTDDKVRGLVVSIAPNEVQVEVIGRKQTGYIPAEELSADPNANPNDIVKVGDELELLIMRTNDQEGTIMLSKKRVDSLKGWNTVVEAEESGEILEGVVSEVIKGGLLVVTNGVRVFVPASHASLQRMEDLTPLLKKTVRMKIIEINTARRRAVASIRLVAREERRAQEEALWGTLEVGQQYTGTVKSLTSYGAFVDLGGVDGMIHISELSWSRIKHPSEVVNVGDEVTVYVRDLDQEKRKISLGYRKAEDNPWEKFKAQYAVGDAVEAKIVGMTAFGAFAQIIPGVDGLIHISQIANRHIDKPQDELKVGQEVRVKITNVDEESKRISLSIRALLEEEGVVAEEAAPAEEEAAPAEEAAE
ncbi:MAG: bifunctional 4-hydroxy-3-methylbut-2-enyl diphosphate reductase/30S ribosomal protein S1 [Clostridia bacterium]|nr:bifunctional 4-hydroxy-3-methylbut-2-enyl diphosphate reductase/30S ribosomal protein S1 [Clostridia bacterium]